MFRNVVAAAIGLAMFGAAGTAGASLIGDQVDLELRAGGGSATDLDVTVVAGGDPEFEIGQFNWDVEASSIRFSLDANTDLILPDDTDFTVSDLHWVDFPAGILEGATISDAGDLFASATDAILTVSDHSLFVDLTSFGGQSLAGEPFILISLQANHEIPEPATMGLFLVGLAGFGLVALRRRRSERAGGSSTPGHRQWLLENAQVPA